MIQGEIVDVPPAAPAVGAEIVPARRESAPSRPILARSGDAPEWFAREFSQDAAKVPWRKRDAGNRGYYERAHAAMERSRVSLPRRPGESDSVALWEQYHFLKALAVRLDAGRGTDLDFELFARGLAEYDLNFDRIAQRKFLPG